MPKISFASGLALEKLPGFRLPETLLTALLGCVFGHLLFAFILTPNTLSPVHQDDYSVLAGTWRDLRLFIERPISTDIAMLLGQGGAGVAFGVLNLLTVVVPALALVFAFELLRLRLNLWLSLVFAAMVYSHAAALEHAKFLGLITNLLSHLFGICTLLIILRAWRSRSIPLGTAGAVTFALSVFSKEDFILPPLLLLLYCVADAWSKRATVAALHDRQVLQAICVRVGAVLLAFVLFTVVIKNPFVHGAIDPAGSQGAYAVDLSLPVVIKSIDQLTFGFARESTLVGLASLLLLAMWPGRFREALLLLLITCSVVLPYALIPNRLMEYRPFGWLPWFASASVLLSAALWHIRGDWHWIRIARIAALTVCGAPLTVAGMQDERRLMVAVWYARAQQGNERIIQELLKVKPRLDHERVVGVAGLDGLSPWSRTDAGYLRRKLGFKQQWVVFVDQPNAYYSIHDEDEMAPVRVTLSRNLCGFGSLLVVRFEGESATLHRAADLCGLKQDAAAAPSE